MDQIVSQLRQTFLTNKTKDLDWREKQLYSFLRMVDDNSEEMCAALHQDLRKHKSEAALMEVGVIRNEVVHMINHLSDYAKPEKVKKNLLTLMDTAHIIREPYGVVLVIGAWNFPFQLSLVPLVGAIAAGNCVIVKPSEISVASSRLIKTLIEKYLDTDCIKVIEGGVPETTALLKEPFDFICYTGNSAVGKIVMRAAAEHLTPTLLELGGKSPAYVDESSDMDVAAQRIVWGKFSNCGQTCIAPDYIMCSNSVQTRLLSSIEDKLKLFYTSDPRSSPDYSRIINDRHFGRIQKLVEADKVAIGGGVDAEDKFMEPTVLRDVTPSDECMKDEIFGPVLPVMPVESIDEAIDFINQGKKPLAMYIFSKDQGVIDKFVGSTSSGGVTVNDTLMHASIPSLPFGGVGNSGIGAYHGHFSFDVFSHKRAYLQKDFGMENLNTIRYPPYTDKKLRWINRLTRATVGGVSFFRSSFFILSIGLIIAALYKYYCRQSSGAAVV